MIEVFVRIRPK